MHVERTFTVRRPVDEVFAYLADFEHTRDWDPGTVRTTRTAGDGGVGTMYANTSSFMGRTTDLTYETVEHRPPSRVVFRGTNDSATTKDTLTFTASGAGTQVHYRADFRFTPLVNLVASVVLRRKLEKLADETVAQITRVLERRPA
ncbi:SRPBCC family protein [Aeromicrobium massiliense]|uniref:SRPBCC family protein n=1 Tax=Aeromicrobium massiliense TaxID=1464554 RepID=UPI0003060376|nr:SRPBCC family protein [Aeromicrobium massiliense]